MLCVHVCYKVDIMVMDCVKHRLYISMIEGMVIHLFGVVLVSGATDVFSESAIACIRLLIFLVLRYVLMYVVYL